MLLHILKALKQAFRSRRLKTKKQQKREEEEEEETTRQIILPRPEREGRNRAKEAKESQGNSENDHFKSSALTF